ncbi:MAG: glycoside hydrolase family 31 protein [Thermomicrobiales bacterium]
MSAQTTAVPVRVEEDGDQVTITSPHITITVRRDPFALTIADENDRTILAPVADSVAAAERYAAEGEFGSRASWDPGTRYLGFTYGIDGNRLGSYNGSGPAPRWYRLTSLRSWKAAPDGARFAVDTDDIVGRHASVQVQILGERAVRVRVTLDRDVAVAEMGLAFATSPGEGFFGLGERFARGNHRGHEVRHQISDAYVDPVPGHNWTYFPIPFVLSSQGYGLMLDTTRSGTFRLGSDREDAWQVSVDGAVLDAVIFTGPEPLDVIEQFTGLTGRPPLPQPWALGVWKTTLSGADSVRAEAQRLRDEDLGVSAVWIYDQLELETNSGWNSAMGYPEGEYPDLPGLVAELHDGGFKVLGYLNTQFIVNRPRTDEGIDKGYFLKRPNGETYLVPGPDPDPEVGIKFGTMALYDPTHPEGVRWWQDLLRTLLLEKGYDGWMHDFGEYTPSDAVFADGRTGEELRNGYPTLYQQTAAEICRQVKPDFSFFVRSGALGSNQWAPSAWPGDQHTDWSWDRGLASIIPAGLSIGICGTNIWGPDIGGFFDAFDGSDAASSVELWVRWCQLGALTPLMRDHLGPKRMTNPNAVDMWTNETTIDTWRRYARLHNALLPYLYAYAARAHETGLPTMRHMVLHYPDFPEALEQDYQYLLGEDLLVAPVVEEGTTTRRVWFPPGTWFSFWDDQRYDGPGYHDVPAPLETIPLFVRGGAILPLLAESVVTLAGVAPDDLLQYLELRVYPTRRNGESRFTFHDGSTITLSEAESSVTLGFDATARSRSYRVRVAGLDDVAPVAPGSAEIQISLDTPDGA